MIENRFLRTVIATVSCFGMILPANVSWAAGPVGAVRSADAATAPTVVDVRLGSGGVLAGRVVDAQGVGVAKTSVVVRQADGTQAKTETDQHGNFSVRGLRGAVYQVVAGPSGQVVRAWAPKTAPPAAHKKVLVVIGQDIVLGQRPPHALGRFWERAKYGATDPLVVGGIIALAVGIPVALSVKDNDSGS